MSGSIYTRVWVAVAVVFVFVFVFVVGDAGASQGLFPHTCMRPVFAAGDPISRDFTCNPYC
jgi:hypothetical protein